MIEQLLTPGDVAERCQVSTKTVLRAIHRGRLRASRLGEHGAFRIREADVERWIETSVLEVPVPARQIAVPVPAVAPASGRLVLAPEMGRSTEGVNFGSPSL